MGVRINLQLQTKMITKNRQRPANISGLVSGSIWKTNSFINSQRLRVFGVAGIRQIVASGIFTLCCRYLEKIMPHFWHSTPLSVCSKPHFGHFIKLNPYKKSSARIGVLPLNVCVSINSGLIRPAINPGAMSGIWVLRFFAKAIYFSFPLLFFSCAPCQ